MHHIKDSHDFHILDWNGHPVSVPLPVILWTNEGLVAFMSSEFHHDDSGATVVKRKNQAFVKFHEEIYYAGNDKEGKYIQLEYVGLGVSNCYFISLSFIFNFSPARFNSPWKPK